MTELKKVQTKPFYKVSAHLRLHLLTMNDQEITRKLRIWARRSRWMASTLEEYADEIDD